MTFDHDIAAIVRQYELPDLPNTSDDSDAARVLVLFRFKDSGIVLTDPITLADAQEYANRNDTTGDGWFVGYSYASDYQAGDTY